MTDSLWLLLMIYTLFSHHNQTERNDTMESYDKTIRETFEATIRTKLENPDVTAEEINQLAHAYSELTKNDNLRDMMRSVSSYSGFSSANAQSQWAQLVPEKADCHGPDGASK